MQEEYASGLYASDDLLARVQADLDAFYWQSHTLTHLSRDNLGKNDCDIEDGGKAVARKCVASPVCSMKISSRLLRAVKRPSCCHAAVAFRFLRGMSGLHRSPRRFQVSARG